MTTAANWVANGASLEDCHSNIFSLVQYTNKPYASLHTHTHTHTQTHTRTRTRKRTQYTTVVSDFVSDHMR